MEKSRNELFLNNELKHHERAKQIAKARKLSPLAIPGTIFKYVKRRKSVSVPVSNVPVRRHFPAEYGDEYYTSASAGDYSPSCPWNAPGMNVSDFIQF